jgi:hypothetical protein
MTASRLSSDSKIGGTPELRPGDTLAASPCRTEESRAPTRADYPGLGRESLYKALARRSKPRYETVRKLLEALVYV